MSNKTQNTTNTTYWSIENDVSNSYNRLKAKLYNLIEASVPDKHQSEAIKGLIKGFCNEEFRSCITNMRYDARNIGLIEDPEDLLLAKIISAEPLESERSPA